MVHSSEQCVFSVRSSNDLRYCSIVIADHYSLFTVRCSRFNGDSEIQDFIEHSLTAILPHNRRIRCSERAVVQVVRQFSSKDHSAPGSRHG